MNPQRFFCSQLVALTNKSTGSTANAIVNLEEIWNTGAVLEAEEPMSEGIEIELRCGPAFFVGRVVEVEPHEFGWRFEVEFSPKTLWNPEEFQPQHLLDLSKLGGE
jgi:hypothetical protein